MITNNDILDAVEAMVVGAFPGEKVYRNYQPADFERPSTLLELSGGKAYPNFGCQGVELRPVLTLTAFAAADAYHQSDTGELCRRQMVLLGLFLPGFVRAGDRAVHVEDKIEMAGGLDYASIAVTLRYTLSRQDFMTLQQLPVAAELHLKQEVDANG